MRGNAGIDARSVDTIRETGTGDSKGPLGASNPSTCEVSGKFELK